MQTWLPAGQTGGGIVVPQMPPKQPSAAAHTLPQTPQFAGSENRFVQTCAPPGPAQAAAPGYVPPPPWQTPFVQIAFAAQALPQAPQLAASRDRSVQKVPPPGPAHDVPGAAHVGAAQTPLLHIVLAGQVRPQAPQLL